jgi:hypothetical protein
MRIVGVWMTAVMAAGMAGAGPITTHSVDVTLDADFTVRASAVCDAAAGQWILRWGVQSGSATATLLSARDPDNGLALTLANTDIEPGRQSNATGTLAGSATVIALEAVLQVSGEASNRTIQRRVPLDEACAQADLGPCVEASTVRYVHTFDGPNGRATARLDGPPPCETRNAVLLRYYWPLGHLDLDELAYGYFTPTNPRSVIYADRLPCDNELRLEIAGGIAGSPGNRSTGPYAQHKQFLGMCLMPNVVDTQLCSSLKLDLGNGAEAKLSAYFVLSRWRPDGSPEVGRYVLAPGQSRSLTFTRDEGQTFFRVSISINGDPILERDWSRPATCDQRDLPPVRTPTPSSSTRPLPPIRR